jgi:hypothetical protein
MPDLVTHTTIGYLIRNRNWTKHILLLFLIGTIFPDLLSRTFMITFPELKWFFHAFHTPIVIVLFALLFSLLFERSLRWLVFKYVLLGAAFHCFLDLFQLGVSETAYLWFFPITVTYDIQIGLFWAEDTLILTPLFTLLFLISYFYEDKIREKISKIFKPKK